MENIKLYVMDEEQSRKAQEKAFSLGLEWKSFLKKEISFTDAPFLYFEQGKITRGQEYPFFKDVNFKELTFEQWMSYEPEEEEMTDIEILGKVWKHKNNKHYSIVSGYEPEGLVFFKINEGWYAKQKLLKDFIHAESLQAVAKEYE